MTNVIALDQLKIKLKERFYEILMTYTQTSFQGCLNDIAKQLKLITHAKAIDVFILNDSTLRYQLCSDPSESNEYIKKEPFHLSTLQQLVNGVNKTFSYPSGDDVLYQPKDDITSFIVPLQIESKHDGFLLFLFDNQSFDQQVVQLFQEIVQETNRLIGKVKFFHKSISVKDKYEMLYRVTSKFHSSMNINDILKEVIFTLQDIYPLYDCFLLLSQDDPQTEGLPVREFDYQNKEYHASTEAYLTGQIQFDDTNDQKASMYAPLKGKQGVYGVLQVVKEKNILFIEDEIEFISILANTAGSALENARLYEQSKCLIADLRLINQSSQELNSKRKLSDTFTYMADLIKHSFKGEEVGFVLYQNNGNTPQILKESTSFFTTNEGRSLITFLNEKIEQKTNMVFIGDFQVKYPDLDLPFQSVMAVPMIHEHQVIGFVTVLHPNEYFFSFETYKLLQSLVQHSALTVVNSLLKEELERLVQTDYLTKLYSRNYLDEMMNQHLEVGQQGTFVLIDIDNFKSINDQFGHDTGDAIILQVAEVIKENIRSHDIAARWGGEELAIYLPNTNIVAGEQVAKRLVKAVATRTSPTVTISCGVSYWDQQINGGSKAIFLRADRALYVAKEQGKNRVVKQNEIAI
ncbi:sensor domain-containing diguanylate cyclase [Salinibacillus xinjiangensis]|nr:diguanylate cyclase [Salinibacillus xinjiangensis]